MEGHARTRVQCEIAMVGALLDLRVILSVCLRRVVASLLHPGAWTHDCGGGPVCGNRGGSWGHTGYARRGISVRRVEPAAAANSIRAPRDCAGARVRNPRLDIVHR